METKRVSKWKLIEKGRHHTIKIVPNYSILDYSEMTIVEKNPSQPLFQPFSTSKSSHFDYYIEDLQGEGLARILRVKNKLQKSIDKLLQERKQVYFDSKYAEYECLFLSWQTLPPENSDKLTLDKVLEAIAVITIICKDHLDDIYYDPQDVKTFENIKYFKRQTLENNRVTNFHEVADEEFRMKILSFNERLWDLRKRWQVVYRWILAATELAARKAILNIITTNKKCYNGIHSVVLEGNSYLFRWILLNGIRNICDLELTYEGCQDRFGFSATNEILECIVST